MRRWRFRGDHWTVRRWRFRGDHCTVRLWRFRGAHSDGLAALDQFDRTDLLSRSGLVELVVTQFCRRVSGA